MSGESGYMPRNFSELKSGGIIPMLSPHAEKWGTRPPSVPHQSTPVQTRTPDQPKSSTIALTHVCTHILMPTLMPALMQTHSCMQVYHSHVLNCCLDIIYTARDSLVIGLASIWQPQRGTVLLAYVTAVTDRDRQTMNSSLSYVVDEHTIHHMAEQRNVTRRYTRRAVGISSLHFCSYIHWMHSARPTTKTVFRTDRSVGPNQWVTVTCSAKPLKRDRRLS